MADDVQFFDDGTSKRVVKTISPVVVVKEAIDLPNYSGIQKAALKTSAPLGGGVDSVFTRIGDVVAATNDYTWAQVDKATSDIADITTKSHASLSSIGTNTHAQIDTHIADTSDPHGANLTQTGITSSGTISGSTVLASGTLSGSAVRTIEDHSVSGSAAIVGIITHTSGTPPTASNYPIGTLYIKYTA